MCARESPIAADETGDRRLMRGVNPMPCYRFGRRRDATDGVQAVIDA